MWVTQRVKNSATVVVAGCRADGAFWLLNSWSEDFGLDGWCLFSPEYIDAGSDYWIVDSAPYFEVL